MDHNSNWNQNEQEQNGSFSSQEGSVQNPYEEHNYVYTETWMNGPAGRQQANPYSHSVQQPQQYYGQPVPTPGYPQPNTGYPMQPNTGYPMQPNNGYPMQPNNGYPMQPRQNGESGFAIAGMVCGILSILCCSLLLIDFFLAIPGLIFSIVALVKNCGGKGMAVAGLICSTIGLCLNLVFLALLVLG